MGPEEKSPPAAAARAEPKKERTLRLDQAGLLCRTVALDVFAREVWRRAQGLVYLTVPGGVRATMDHLELPSRPALLVTAQFTWC